MYVTSILNQCWAGTRLEPWCIGLIQGRVSKNRPDLYDLRKYQVHTHTCQVGIWGHTRLVPVPASYREGVKVNTRLNMRLFWSQYRVYSCHISTINQTWTLVVGLGWYESFLNMQYQYLLVVLKKREKYDTSARLVRIFFNKNSILVSVGMIKSWYPPNTSSMWSTLDSNYEGEIAISSMFIKGLSYSVGPLYGLKQPFFWANQCQILALARIILQAKQIEFCQRRLWLWMVVIGSHPQHPFILPPHH